MSDESSPGPGPGAGNGNGNGAATPPAGEAQAERPQLSIRAQYVKDLSFENPRAPQNFAANAAPKMDISVSVNGKPYGEDAHEVDLQITAKAAVDETTVFLVELTYGGVFAISGVPGEQMQAVLMVECPRMLFPFARRVIADCTRDGGYPPLMLEPIDFVQMFLRHQQEQAARQDAAAPPPPSNR